MRRLIILLCLLLPDVLLGADDDAAVDYLKGLSIDQLSEVEVQLDDTFDIFDGLLQTRTLEASSGYEQSTRRSPAVASVITAQDIKAMGARTMDEALRAVPGLHVSYSGSGYMPIYTIRGIRSAANPEVLVLVDGVSVNSLESGAPGLSWVRIPVESISRIEVVRGPGSAVYGADAFAGVINIITKNADEIDGAEVGIRYGSYDTRETWILHGDNYDGFETMLSLEAFSTDGMTYDVDHEVAEPHNPESLDLRGEGATLRAKIGYGNWSLTSSFQNRNDLGHGGLDMIGEYDPDSYYAEERLTVDLNYRTLDLHPDWQLDGEFSYAQNRFDLYFNLYPPGIESLYPDGVIIDTSVHERRTRLAGSALYAGLPNHLIRLGGGVARYDLYKLQAVTNQGLDANGDPILPGSDPVNLTGTPYAFLPEKARDNVYLFIQDAWRPAERWEITGGLRYDHYNDFGSSLNPRLALVWQTTPRLTSKLLYGRAFRAPSYREMYMNNNTFIMGNPDLDPEIMDMGELAFDWQAKENINLTFNLFSYRIQDKISFVSGEDEASSKAQNFDTWQGHGLELELRWKIGNRSSLLANYAWAESENQDNNSISHYPHHQAYLRYDLLLVPNWYLNTQMIWYADREASTEEETALIADDSLQTDVTLRYKPREDANLEMAIGIRNLFDQDIRDQEYVPLPGRNGFVEFRYRL